MSDAAKKKEEKPAEVKDAHAGGEAKKAGLLSKLPVVLGGAMAIEAVVLFAGFKMLSKSPTPAAAAELSVVASEDGEGHEAKADVEKSAEHGESAEHAEHAAEAAHGEKAEAPTSKIDRKKPCEIQVVDFRAPNKQSGRTFLYDITIFAVTRGANKEKVESAFKSRDALVKDRIRTIIAQLDPEKLGGGSEPGLETLRRQVKYQLDEIVGDGMIDEVLVPRCIPFRTDY